MTNPADALGDAVLLTSYLDDVLKPANAARLSAQFKAVWEVSHLDLRLALAEAGRGITYLSDRILADEENMHAMTRLEAINIPRQVGIYYRKDQPLSAGAARFVALCDNHFQSTRA